MHPARRPRSIVTLLAAILVAFLAPAVLGAGTPEQICDAAKAKAAAKRASAKIGCNAKAMAKGVMGDIECLDKAGEKFLAAYAKADAKGPCEGRDAAYFEFLTDQFMSNVLIAVQCRNAGTSCTASAQCCSGQCISLICQ